MKDYDRELEHQIVARVQSLLPFPVSPDELRTLTNSLVPFIQSREQVAEVRAHINELTAFEPLQRDHSKCLDPISCIGYQNAVSDFDNEKEIRLAALHSQQEGPDHAK